MKVLFVLSLFLIYASCGDRNDVQGYWSSLDDFKSSIIVNEREFIFCYSGADSDTFSWEMLSWSCDLNYYNQADGHAQFLRIYNEIRETYCYEIVGINDTLSLIFTGNGRLLQFERK